VTEVSGELHRRYGDDATIPAVKQSIGISIRAVLEDECFRVVEKGVPLKKDPIFRTGSVYAPVEQRPPAPRNYSRLCWPHSPPRSQCSLRGFWRMPTRALSGRLWHNPIKAITTNERVEKRYVTHDAP
jgi:hypothetical protein